jgi:hypothetical protein
LSTHIRFHLISQGFDSSGINNLIKGSFDIQAVKDSAQAVVGKDGRVKSLHQAEAELILSKHDKTQSWVNLELGMTKKQLPYKPGDKHGLKYQVRRSKFA